MENLNLVHLSLLQAQLFLLLTTVEQQIVPNTHNGVLLPNKSGNPYYAYEL